jgi:hypothetical protein
MGIFEIASKEKPPEGGPQDQNSGYGGKNGAPAEPAVGSGD